MTTRRNLLLALSAGSLAAAIPAYSQQQGKVWRVAYLSAIAGPDSQVDALRDALAKLGYIEGRNIAFEYRWGAGRESRMQELAEELVRLKVDVIVTRGNSVALAAKRATSTTPIVMATGTDPVGVGVIASLARPGGNVTGVTGNGTETDGKRLQLLHEMVPKVTRVSTLTWDKSPAKPLFLDQIGKAARQMGITLINQEVSAPDGVEPAFAAMQRSRVQALTVENDALLGNHIKQIVDLAARHRLPAIYQANVWTDGGGLMYYGVSRIELHRLAATYVDRILKGAKPADLPVEEPTKYELVINLKAAKALGLTIPRSMLLRADEVIQ